MAIMTREQFQASIRARKPMNVWFLGEKVDDLTAFPHWRPASTQSPRSMSSTAIPTGWTWSPQSPP